VLLCILLVMDHVLDPPDPVVPEAVLPEPVVVE
jgi:hypothetical protein